MSAVPALLHGARAFELPGSPDLAALAGSARDLGYEVMLFERPMPDAVSVLGIGRVIDISSIPSGVAAEDSRGRRLDAEIGPEVAAAGRLWKRLAAGIEVSGQPGLPATGAVAVGGFAFDPGTEPRGPWSGLPGLLLRVPALSVARVRGRTFACVLDP